MNQISVSIVISVYNEVNAIPALCENLKKLTAPCEIIVVDGGSSDNSMGVVDAAFRCVQSPERGRASQMNYGAARSTGNILLFLHADSCLPVNAVELIQDTVRKGCQVGCFHLAFDSPRLLMRICAALSNLRVRLRNIAFGDQGIFITKEYFEQLGGFPPLPLMEDYRFSMNVKEDGQRFAMVPGRLITSDRRFRKYGLLCTIWMMQKLQYQFRHGGDVYQIADTYRRADGSEGKL